MLSMIFEGSRNGRNNSRFVKVKISAPHKNCQEWNRSLFCSDIRSYINHRKVRGCTLSRAVPRSFRVMVRSSLLVALAAALALSGVSGFVPSPLRSRGSISIQNSQSILASDRLSSALASIAGVEELYWEGPEQLRIQVLASKAQTQAPAPQTATAPTFLQGVQKMLGMGVGSTATAPGKQPILFVHGSFHSAWCFSEHFMPYFSQRGHDCYAISLRGTGPTGLPVVQGVQGAKPAKSVRVEQHVVSQ
jgi:hypothetical protein